jgi:DNA-binding MarR family transcriptional regulator
VGVPDAIHGPVGGLFHQFRYIVPDVNGPELFRLGRRLMKVGVQATPHAGFRDLPKGVRIVLVDVHEHPDSTIGQIVERTGFPQSHVSAAVARLRDSGALVTTTDPNDRRRTLVRPVRRRPRLSADAQSAAAVTRGVHDLLVELHGEDGARYTDEVVAALATLSSRLCPTTTITPTGPAATSTETTSC